MKKPPTKKAKTEDLPPTNINESLEATKHHFKENSITSSIDFDSLAEFLTESYEKRETVQLALKYSPDLTQLATMLKSTNDHIVMCSSTIIEHKNESVAKR